MTTHWALGSQNEVLAEELKETSWWRVVRSLLIFRVLRHCPLWTGWLPMHQPQHLE
jgi:cardiolipin synthase